MGLRETEGRGIEYLIVVGVFGGDVASSVQLELFNLKRERKQQWRMGEVMKHMGVIKSIERKIAPNL